MNLEEARNLRASGASYRQIRRQLELSAGQVGHIRRVLAREKAAGTRLRRSMPDATDRDLPVSQSVLPPGLRRQLAESGYRTLGDLADRLCHSGLPGLETISGIGPHKAALVRRLLDHYRLLPGKEDLRGAVEALFPDLAEP